MERATPTSTDPGDVRRELVVFMGGEKEYRTWREPDASAPRQSRPVAPVEEDGVLVVRSVELPPPVTEEPVRLWDLDWPPEAAVPTFPVRRVRRVRSWPRRAMRGRTRSRRRGSLRRSRAPNDDDPGGEPDAAGEPLRLTLALARWRVWTIALAIVPLAVVRSRANNAAADVAWHLSRRPR